MAQRKLYEGPERRVHKVYVTKHTEYHVREGVCVAVKERASKDSFVDKHGALKMKLEGHVKIGTLFPMPGPPKLGFRMYFANDGSDILTSPVVAILRPKRDIVAKYPKT